MSPDHIEKIEKKDWRRIMGVSSYNKWHNGQLEKKKHQKLPLFKRCCTSRCQMPRKRTFLCQCKNIVYHLS